MKTGQSNAKETGKEPAAVLLVDDDPRNLLALESLLENEDYDLVKAHTGGEALLALMSGDFAAIVLDVQMPEVNGIELARLIKQRRRTQHIPIIFLTAHYREDEDVMMAYDVGAVDYLTKPIHPAVLRSKVNVFVDLFRKTRALAALNAQLETQNIILQRETEERMRRIEAESARAEAEAANAAKDHFLAMLSHELRTPLTPIVCAVDLLERDETCTPDARELLATIQRNVQLEVRLIDDLLDLSRIRRGKLTLRMQATDAHEALREAIRICQADISKRRIRLIERFEASLTQIQGDPARLQQIFWNLLANAAKFTPEGGVIMVSTANPENGGPLVVEIRDTGPGIEPQKLERIFDAFEQGAHNPSSGLGLGLAICRALVDLHEGTIEAHSDGPGCGALFTVKLPATAPARREEAPEPAEAPESAMQRLLLVDDHRDTAEILRRLLSWRGYEVRIAGSITQAVEVAEDYPFDILISDIGLPDGRGTDLLIRLQDRSERPINAIAMSGFGMEEDIQRSRRAGFAEHLIKPVELDALQQAIARLTPAPASPAVAE